MRIVVCAPIRSTSPCKTRAQARPRRHTLARPVRRGLSCSVLRCRVRPVGGRPHAKPRRPWTSERRTPHIYHIHIRLPFPSLPPAQPRSSAGCALPLRSCVPASRGEDLLRRRPATPGDLTATCHLTGTLRGPACSVLHSAVFSPPTALRARLSLSMRHVHAAAPLALASARLLANLLPTLLLLPLAPPLTRRSQIHAPAARAVRSPRPSRSSAPGS